MTPRKREVLQLITKGLSTSNNIDDISHCYQLNCNAYVEKEMMHDKLADTLKAFVAQEMPECRQLKGCI